MSGISANFIAIQINAFADFVLYKMKLKDSFSSFRHLLDTVLSISNIDNELFLT